MTTSVHQPTTKPSQSHPKNKQRRVMPFFGLSLGVSVFALSLLVALPFIMMILTTLDMGVSEIVSTIFEPQVFAAIKLSLSMAILATLTNLVFGTLIAWVLVRYEFWGKSILNALVDLPFALPTAVTGIALATLYAPNGLFGQVFAKLGTLLTGEPIKIAFTPIGIWLAFLS